MERILGECKTDDRWPLEVRSEFRTEGFKFLVLFSALGRHYATQAPAQKLFDVTVKAHYLGHAILQSWWQNPILG
eukprot:8751885-Pyramimonas_sp.AAC.1